MRHEEVCREVTASKKSKMEPMKDQLLAITSGDADLTEYETAFQNRLKSYFIRGSKCFDLNCFLQESKSRFIDLILKQLKEHKTLKVNLMVECQFCNILGETTDRSFKTRNAPVFEETDLELFITDKLKKLIRQMEESQTKKSGWSFLAVDGLRL
jgi:hypothetical protein